jgi:hypothetical protein
MEGVEAKLSPKAVVLWRVLIDSFDGRRLALVSIVPSWIIRAFDGLLMPFTQVVQYFQAILKIVWVARLPMMVLMELACLFLHFKPA